MAAAAAPSMAFLGAAGMFVPAPRLATALLSSADATAQRPDDALDLRIRELHLTERPLVWVAGPSDLAGRPPAAHEAIRLVPSHNAQPKLHLLAELVVAGEAGGEVLMLLGRGRSSQAVVNKLHGLVACRGRRASWCGWRRWCRCRWRRVALVAVARRRCTVGRWRRPSRVVTVAMRLLVRRVRRLGIATPSPLGGAPLLRSSARIRIPTAWRRLVHPSGCSWLRSHFWWSSPTATIATPAPTRVVIARWR
mmetsp:Transcript_114681/g.255850  ORF Transcript_114681/g.255850 Transcript_114681/m.255850 type:complete len:251 (-) Transcript_114681:951-1703(-)